MSTETSKIEGDKALARRRRKVKLSRKNDNDKRLRDEEPDEILSGPNKKKPHPTGIKVQARYDPGVPMNRQELTAWRKEARRVRNRESAAASRRRTRDKIDELEAKLATMENKYAAALKRIVELEAAAASSAVSNDSQLPVTVSQEQTAKEESQTVVSPISSPQLTSVVSPAISPRSSFSLDDSHHQEIVEQKYQHIMEMISRPTA